MTRKMYAPIWMLPEHAPFSQHSQAQQPELERLPVSQVKYRRSYGQRPDCKGWGLKEKHA